MAVAVDAVSASLIRNEVANDTNTTGDITTVSASATYVLALLEASLSGGTSDAGITFTTATIEGNALTELTLAKSHSGGGAVPGTGTTGFVDIYGRAAPPTGAGVTLSLTEHSGTASNIHCLLAFAVSFTGAISGLGTPARANTAGAASLTVTDTLASGDLFIGICCNGTSVPTVTTGTSIATATGTGVTASHAGIRVATNSGVGSVSITFGTNAADGSAAVGVKLISTVAAGFIAAPPTILRQAVHRAAYI